MTKMKKDGVTYEIKDTRVQKLLKRGFTLVEEKEVKSKTNKVESDIKDEDQSEGD